MSHNATAVVEMNEILKNKEKYAELFCEGDKDLKELLLWSWKNSISTQACCCGHGHVGYISFQIVEKNYDLFLYLYETFRHKKGYDMYIYPTQFGVYLKGSKEETNFVDILTILKSFKKVENSKIQELLEIIDSNNKFVNYIKIYPFSNTMFVSWNAKYDLNNLSIEEVKQDFAFFKKN